VNYPEPSVGPSGSDPDGPPGSGPDRAAQPRVAPASPWPPYETSPLLPSGEESRRRLHPLSPLLHGAKSLVVIVAALSWQTLSSVGFGWFVAMVVILVLGAVVLSMISWYNTGYHVVGRELRIHEGLLWRRTRAIPLERLQAVEVVRPLLAQVSGLAELRLEVVGGEKTEAPLAYLGVGDAIALRERLLALAGRGAYDARVPVVQRGRRLHAVANRDLLVSQLLTPQAFALPFGVAFVLVQFLSEGSFSFIGVASTLTAMAGVVLQPTRRVLADWSFRLARDDTGLRVARGLLETRAQTVPLNRVQAIRATWPLLWRPNGWLRLRLEVAGYGVPGGEGTDRPDRLLPVGDLPTGQRILDEVLPGVDLAAPGLTPPPPQARWLNPVARPAMGAGLTDEVFAVREGLLTRNLVMVPYARIQSVRVVRGPLQRLLGLATVHVDAAGGSGAAAQDRDVGEAWEWAADLAARARAARSAPRAP
jgi:putative membrane protein